MDFRILSYNIHRAIGVDRRFRPERIAVILDHYDADIVLLQEVDVGVPRSRELNLAQELAELCNYPYYAAYAPKSLGYFMAAVIRAPPLISPGA